MNSFTQSPQWIAGNKAADFLDRHFRAEGWQIEPTTEYEERTLCRGDRHYFRNDEHYLVEYKSDAQTSRTGNVFLETISVDSQNKLGWVYTCAADFIFYYIPDNHKILIWKPSVLRKNIEQLKVHFWTAKTNKNQNQGYNTHGVLVPLAEAERRFTFQTILLPY